MPEHKVLGDREGGCQPEMLVDHPDAGFDRVARRREAHGFAVKKDLALIRAVEASQNIRQGRFSRAVLPSRAWISPRRTSKSMPSLARTPGNRLVIPRIVTAGGLSASTPPS